MKHRVRRAEICAFAVPLGVFGRVTCLVADPLSVLLRSGSLEVLATTCIHAEVLCASAEPSQLTAEGRTPLQAPK